MADVTARDIMTTEVVTVSPEMSIRELATVFARSAISGAPVVDGGGRLVGIVTEGDIIVQDADLHFPHYIQIFESIIYVESVRKFEERFRKAFGARVEDIMSREVMTVAPTTTLHEIATLMADRNVNRVPVLDGDRLVGIITRADIVRAMAEGKG